MKHEGGKAAIQPQPVQSPPPDALGPPCAVFRNQLQDP
jgi:hypothetical protein